MSDLNKKVDRAIMLLKVAEEAAMQKSIEREREREREVINELRDFDLNGTVEISYSTGKDSDVILRLAQMAGIKHIPIYKMTGLDQGSEKHAKEKGAVILKPKKNFFDLIELGGFPTRRARFCCQYLKEYKVLDVAVQGIRTSESTARAERYKEPEICRLYNKKERVQVFLPILDWTDSDVAEFIQQEKIQCHPHYYDEEGVFHVERRVGCVCCCMKSQRKLIKDFTDHPKMVKAYIKHGKVWWESHPNAKSHEKFPCIYDLFFHNVFCDSYQDYIQKTSGLFGRLDTKQWLEDYFHIELP